MRKNRFFCALALLASLAAEGCFTSASERNNLTNWDKVKRRFVYDDYISGLNYEISFSEKRISEYRERCLDDPNRASGYESIIEVLETHIKNKLEKVKEYKRLRELE